MRIVNLQPINRYIPRRKFARDPGKLLHISTLTEKRKEAAMDIETEKEGMELDVVG